MWRTRIRMTELAFLVCGLLIIFVGWTADFLGVFEFASAPGGHGSGTTFPLRLFMTMFGVSFATIGVGFENFPQILQDGDRAKRYIVAFLFLADGSLHLYAFNDHLGDLFSATFFAVFSVLQLAAAFIIPYTRFRLDLAWLGITAFLILAYIVTRTMAVWPIGVVEEVEPLGVDRKSTRLNSSHSQISYAVFCLKKKTHRRSGGPLPSLRWWSASSARLRRPRRQRRSRAPRRLARAGAEHLAGRALRSTCSYLRD